MIDSLSLNSPSALTAMNSGLDDPLTLALRPPPEETELERRERVAREAEAKLISERIDEELRHEREIAKKRKEDVKVGDFPGRRAISVAFPSFLLLNA